MKRQSFQGLEIIQGLSIGALSIGDFSWSQWTFSLPPKPWFDLFGEVRKISTLRFWCFVKTLNVKHHKFYQNIKDLSMLLKFENINVLNLPNIEKNIKYQKHIKFKVTS